MNLVITKHASDQVKFRTEHKTKEKANIFITRLFPTLLNNNYYKERKIKVKHSYNDSMIVTDWHHKFIYKIENNNHVIITYAVVDTYTNKVEWMFYNIFKRIKIK